MSGRAKSPASKYGLAAQPRPEASQRILEEVAFPDGLRLTRCEEITHEAIYLPYRRGDQSQPVDNVTNY
jgi:hypothetical protein